MVFFLIIGYVVIKYLTTKSQLEVATDFHTILWWTHTEGLNHLTQWAIGGGPAFKATLDAAHVGFFEYFCNIELSNENQVPGLLKDLISIGTHTYDGPTSDQLETLLNDNGYSFGYPQDFLSYEEAQCLRRRHLVLEFLNIYYQIALSDYYSIWNGYTRSLGIGFPWASKDKNIFGGDV